MRTHPPLFITALALTTALAAVPLAASGGEAAGAEGPAPFVATISAAGVSWQAQVPYERLHLRITGPGGLVVEETFAAGEDPFVSLADPGRAPLADGAYTWELTAAPLLDPGTRERLAAARRAGDDAAVAELRRVGALPAEPLVQSGHFTVREGALLVPGHEREPAAPLTAVTEPLTAVTAADQVIPDDLIVQGSLCAGLDCINNEDFSFDTLRLKENNTRIKFHDTSLAGFATRDWMLEANQDGSGGASYLAARDCGDTGAAGPDCGGTAVFLMEAGAPANSIYLDDSGHVGFRTATPVLDLHVNTGNTPALRLEQNSSSGFTAQTWDIAGNEANFFIRDVTGGSRLSFRIRPGAPTSSIDISGDGDVGVGTASPDVPLHVFRANGTAKVQVEETNGITQARELFKLVNNGGPFFVFADTSLSESWSFSMGATGDFLLSHQQTGGVEARLQPDGDLIIAGSLTQASSRTIKEEIELVEPAAVLAQVLELPIAEWSYRGDEQQARHLGPMAEDFHAAFGLGRDDQGIAPSDTGGVALAAIQGLHAALERERASGREKDAKIRTLEEQNAVFAERLQRLEAVLGTRAPEQVPMR